MQKPFELPAKLPPVRSGRKPIFKQTKPNRKVLVLDLDETIYNCVTVKSTDVNKAKSEGHNVVQIPGLNCVLYLRPGAKEFLLRARKKFDLAVFTKAKKEFADEALKLLELGKILKPNNEKNTFRLYRDSFEQGKDLRKFGFDLNKIILIDDTSIVNFQPNSVSLHGKRYATNGIRISEFKVRDPSAKKGGLETTSKYWDLKYAITDEMRYKSVAEFNKLSGFIDRLSKMPDVRPAILKRAYENDETAEI